MVWKDTMIEPQDIREFLEDESRRGVKIPREEGSAQTLAKRVYEILASLYKVRVVIADNEVYLLKDKQ